ncbi:MAG: STN domain-containing protein [Bacillota bacterium]
MKNSKKVYIICLVFIGLLLPAFSTGTVGVSAREEIISLDVREADLRDVLSALAIKTNTNIVLIEKPVKVTFSVENVSPMEALDLLLKNEGLSYIKDGKILVVGNEQKLRDVGFTTATLTRFDFIYIRGNQLQTLINTLGIPVKSFVLESNPRSIWVQGTPDDLIKIKELIAAVDIVENFYLDDGEIINFAFKELKTYVVEPSRLVELIKETGIPLNKYVTIGNRLLVFDEAIIESWSQLQRVAMELDRLEGRNKTVFIYRFEHLVAKDAVTRMDSFGYDGLELLAFNFPELSREIIVICPPELEPQIYISLKAIDVAREKIKATITSASGSYAMERLKALRTILTEMSPVISTSMHISENLSGDSANPHYILWAEETPDRIKMLQELVASFDKKKDEAK